VNNKNKIIQYNQLSKVITLVKKTDKTIVLVTGVFDLLHQGHIKFLQKAKESGDILLVGLESDERVKQIKGSNRPIEDIRKRIENIIQLPFVDFALALPSNFDSIERERFICIVKPDILAVSSHTQYLDKKKKIIEKYGGKLIVVIKRDNKYSTTQIIKKSNYKSRVPNNS